jgi:hypothetical protein
MRCRLLPKSQVLDDSESSEDEQAIVPQEFLRDAIFRRRLGEEASPGVEGQETDEAGQANRHQGAAVRRLGHVLLDGEPASEALPAE